MEQQLQRGRARLAELPHVLIVRVQALLLQVRAPRIGVEAKRLALGLRCLQLGLLARPRGVVRRAGSAEAVDQREPTAGKSEVIPARLFERPLRLARVRAGGGGKPGDVCPDGRSNRSAPPFPAVPAALSGS